MGKRYINMVQAEYLLTKSSAKTKYKSEAARDLIMVMDMMKHMTEGERKRAMYIDYEESAVVLNGGHAMFYFDPKAIDVIDFNKKGEEQ